MSFSTHKSGPVALSKKTHIDNDEDPWVCILLVILREETGFFKKIVTKISRLKNFRQMGQESLAGNIKKTDLVNLVHKPIQK